MGFFKKDWTKELERAEAFLADDVPVAALEIAERAERKADPDLRAQAAGLVMRARQALLDSVVAKADLAEAAGDFEDAADWLRSAVEREPSAVRRAELERRIETLLERGFDQENRWEGGEITVSAAADEALDPGDVAFQYETLTTMLRDEVRELYAGRTPEFQQAVVDLHQGRVADALAVLQGAAAADADDGIAHLELAQALFFSGEAATAKTHYAAAWRVLGDEPLSDDDSLIVPSLWAQAALDAGAAEEVVERLEGLAEPATGHVHLCRLFAKSLMIAGNQPRALEYLEELVPLVPSDSELNLLFAEALTADGQIARARQGLERAVEASCGVGCASPKPHHGSFRLLASLHLLEGGEPERCRELIAWIAKNQQGHLGHEEHEILAAYYRRTGDTAAAESAASEAARLADAGDDAVAPVNADLGGQQGRVL